MRTVVQDLRYSVRQLVSRPGLTLTALVSLALGIGATTAVFSVIYAALIDPYPFVGADRIVRLTMQSKAGQGDWVNLNGPQIREVRQLGIVESLLAMDYHAMILTGHEIPENVNAIGLIANGFADLGVPPLLGRGLLPSDAIEGQDAQAVTVVSYKFWQTHFLSDPEVVGKTIQLDRKNYTIVGVAAPRFRWYSADVYLPLKLTQDPGPTYIINLRLRKGVTREAADAALQPLVDQFAIDMPKHFPEHFRVNVEGLNEWVVRSISGTLYLLFGGVALLLAIGCGNVSILLLARGTARQHELAVRAAIGAGRGRIARQLLTESLFLATIGAALGVLASYGILAGIRVLLPPYAFAPEVVIRINLPVLFFSVGVGLLTGILSGSWPAWRLSRTQAGQLMQANVRRLAGSVAGRRTNNVLIAGQIALTLLLLAGAGAAMEAFEGLMHKPLGYDPRHVMSVGIPLHDGAYTTWAARAAYFEQMRAKVAETPGVTMAAISSNATPPRNGGKTQFEILEKPSAEEQMTSVNLVSPGYFAILRIPLLQGRIWNETENQNGAHIAVINRTLAQRYFPNGDAIGHSVKLPKIEDRPPSILSASNIADSWLQIVGIVEDARNDGLRDPVKPAVYVPNTLSMWQGTQILVRSEAPPLTLVHAVQKQLAAVNPDQQTYSIVRDLETRISDLPEWQQEHLAAWIFGILAWLALALAAIGLYCVVSYVVAQRTNEFGIRMALGAQPTQVLRIVFASTVVSVGSGIAAGLALTLMMNRILESWVGGNARDPIILVGGALLLSLVAMLACAIPARHASRLDPMVALRNE
ncbi:MAG: ABC transporter permease [Acidobacteria bacterium]|nr:MAG: ABC transporter permease [Acidobacteriota bacterium]